MLDIINFKFAIDIDFILYFLLIKLLKRGFYVRGSRRKSIKEAALRTVRL